MAINWKDVGCGAFFIVAGFFYGLTAWSGLPVGRALNMGPGYFPVVLSGILVVLGFAVAVRGLFRGPGIRFGIMPWRAIFMLTLALLLFAAFFRELGMFLGVFVTAMVASLSSSQIKPIRAGAVSLFIAVFCVLVFSYGIDLPVPVFGTWFGN